MTIRRPPRGVRATTSAFVALFVLGASMLMGGPVRADTASELKAAEAKLNTLIGEISAANTQLSALQSELNVLAGQISDNEDAIAKTQADILTTQRAIQKLNSNIAARQGVLDQRAVAAYEQGPGSDLAFFLQAQSLTDLQDRIEIVNAAAASDRNLIDGMTQTKNQLRVKQQELQGLQAQLQTKLRSLQSQRADLDSKFAQEQDLLNTLASEKATASSLVEKLKKQRAHEIYLAKLAAAAAAQQGFGGSSGGGSISGVFHVCPVDQPHGYSDSFGAPRYSGGYHPHAGNDIMAPEGTPIRAPFSGRAVATPNGLGGNAVEVMGSAGYVYNAHLSRYGQLGSVAAGTVIGYVGHTGDTATPHDHFEWHPYQIPANPWRSPYGFTVINGAIDPYPYLNSVC